MKRIMAAAVTVLLAATAAAAQYGSPSPLTPQTVQDQMERDRTQERLEPDSQKSVKLAPDKQQLVHDTTALSKSLGLSCDVTDAVLLSQGRGTINGKSVNIRNYETTCANGLGYFMVDPSPEPADAFTCFHADALHTADLAAKREDAQPLCTLTPNADVKRAAGTVLSRLGQQCQVTALRVIGVDTRARTELTEAACSGGTGYVIASPLPGTTQGVSALACPDSYRRNIPCRLSYNGAPLVTLDTFKQVLAQHGEVKCTVQEVRLIGKQSVKKRHVVEFKCPEQPDGLVAFIPLEDGAAPFETMTCLTAGAKEQIICRLTQIH